MKIHVAEFSIEKILHSGDMNAKEFLKLYSEADLVQLMINKTEGDAIGQGRWMQAKLVEYDGKKDSEYDMMKEISTRWSGLKEIINLPYKVEEISPRCPVKKIDAKKDLKNFDWKEMYDEIKKAYDILESFSEEELKEIRETGDKIAISFADGMDDAWNGIYIAKDALVDLMKKLEIKF